MRNPLQVAVVGVTGYTGLELARILLRHPALQPPVFFVRETNGANCLAELFPQFRGWGEAPLRPLSVDAITSSNAGTAFLATPHEVSAELAPALLQAGLRVVDLSGAFRFRAAETFTSWYKLPAPHAAWLSEAVYGIPELYSSEIAKARLVANPGCYATSVILALRPLTQKNLLAPGAGVVCDCKSGASGAGKDPRRDLHFVEVDENFKAWPFHSPSHAGNSRTHWSRRITAYFFHPSAAAFARHSFYHLRHSRRIANRRGHRVALSPVLRWPADGSHLARRQLAGAAARRAHKFLRYRIRAGPFGT